MRTLALLLGLMLAVPATGAESSPVTRRLLDQSLAKGRQFLLECQKPEGNFVYQYDFIGKRQIPGLSPVRQAGALWGVALIHRDCPTKETAAALGRGFDFFERHSPIADSGSRYVVYPGTAVGSTGTVALTALALIEYLRSGPPVAEAAARGKVLDGYLAMLLALRREDGLFHRSYRHDGTPFGPPSPYYDGEALLALCRAARHLSRGDVLRERILESARAMYATHVTAARRRDADSAETKGFYQWGSMSFLEIHRAGFADHDLFAERTVELAHWMIDTHRTLARTRNTAYAHEGLISAFALAEDIGDRAATIKIRRVVEAGLGKLLTWQVGGPVMNSYLREHETTDPLAVGGVLNAADEPLLRIDVTQHQMHAVLLAREHMFADQSPEGEDE